MRLEGRIRNRNRAFLTLNVWRGTGRGEGFATPIEFVIDTGLSRALFLGRTSAALLGITKAAYSELPFGLDLHDAIGRPFHVRIAPVRVCLNRWIPARACVSLGTERNLIGLPLLLDSRLDLGGEDFTWVRPRPRRWFRGSG